ncbi:SGNH-like hydrolase/esterase family protein [Bacteroides heparinolyticus]|uniref:SGNH-like hydrolase/esterase family protein n=1 Tax=Prevotella heparinolytica TaxID=28113 RepID=A0A4R2LUG0_9BACE|nr:SGNH/GDSL hydrolase family protein [Bacteroides heparinolyticus]TCO93761.1 SGNH-like hydrolase/esterase family protein [Bacteroides heparinolyticus]
MRTKVFLLGLLLTVAANAQIVYHDASAFPLLGKATESTLTRYERLPDSLQSVSRKPLWELGRNSAGLAVRFRSNSTCIAARWETRNNFRMNHMTPTGICGLDLYCLQDGRWMFAGSGRPAGKFTEAVIVGNMTPEEREYLLFLPLYDGITSLAIGVDSLSMIGCPAVDLPKREKPIAFYGTSILQGGCASRPGMAHTNILERRLNRECINLGFSGNALLDWEIADVLTGVDASLFVLDFVPNASVIQIQERADRFYSIIRSRHPDTPILFVEDPIFTHSALDTKIANEIKAKNEALGAFFRSLKQRGERHIYFLSSRDIIGHDGEATVDGIHFTDLGFMRYAEVLYPICNALLNGVEGSALLTEPGSR